MCGDACCSSAPQECQATGLQTYLAACRSKNKFYEGF